jgi:hypothetical protein
MASGGERFLPTVVDSRSARRAALYSVVASAILSGLFTYFIAVGHESYRSIFAVGYAVAFTVAALGTWFLSRAAAITALLLYFTLHHANDVPIKLAVHFILYVAFATGVRATWQFHRLKLKA